MTSTTISMPKRDRPTAWTHHVQFRQLQTNDGNGKVKRRQGYADQEFLESAADVLEFLDDSVVEVNNTRWSYRVSITQRDGHAKVRVFRNTQPKAVIGWARGVVA